MTDDAEEKVTEDMMICALKDLSTKLWIKSAYSDKEEIKVIITKMKNIIEVLNNKYNNFN